MEIFEGLQFALSVKMILINCFITVFAIVMGALPGVGSGLTMALLMPFTFFMHPAQALLILGAVYNAAIYGGGISSILLNTPGTPGNAATCMDGYALSRKGRAGEALGISLMSSVAAGLISVVVLMTIAPSVARFSLMFGPAEYFWLGLWGLSIVASVASKDFAKALVATAIGFMVSFIGYDLISGNIRYTFGVMELFDGVGLLAIVIGVFAVAEVLSLSTQRTRISDVPEVVGGVVKGLMIPFKHIGLFMKSTGIGVVLGGVPGVGMVAASFMAYAEARRTSKKPEEFGEGSAEGIIAPEAANNATTGGSLIPALTLGIPGSETTAIFLGAVFMHGLRPGHDLFTKHGEVAYSLMFGMMLGLIFILMWGVLLAKYWAKVTMVPAKVLMPALIVVMGIGSYAVHNSLFDVRVAMIFGLIGYIMRKYKYSTICFLLAFILSPIIEENYVKALLIGGGDPAVLIKNPMAIVLCAITILSLAYGIYRDYVRPKAIKAG